jgi:predicted phosphodiesterase
MRIAVISDIHGNCISLDAVLADLKQESIDQFICLGDAIR